MMISTPGSYQGKRMFSLLERKTKVRVKERIRYLLDDIDNLHMQFNEEYPNNQVSPTIFFQL